MSAIRATCLALCVGLAVLASASPAAAQDRRFALLVGHEQGWKKDPTLRYALRGDLRPLARTLRRIGFQVETVENQGPKQLRKALARLRKRAQKRPRIDTFLFYYSGHSDRRFLHLGPKSQTPPVSYQELVKTFKQLPFARRYIILDSCFSGEIIRKFGSLKRYKHLVPKGARARRLIDLSRNFVAPSDERSLQVISSGLAVSWESQRYKASIFTHHLLQGLRGRADRDLNGQISTYELFDYVSDAMMRDIQEKPKMFGVIRRSSSYALAPAYNSHLWIGSQVKGRLQVSVANFYWSWNKRHQQPVRLALIHGKGTVELRRGDRCWRQRVALPKGQEVRLSGRWKTATCKRFAKVSKGSIQLPMTIDTPPPSPWRFSLGMGTQLSALTGDALLMGGEFGLRRRFFGVYLGLWGASSQWRQSTTSQLLLNARIEGGYRHRWGWFSLFVGGYAAAALAIQDVGVRNGAGLGFRYGLTLAPTFWLHRHWGLGLHGRVGFDLAELGQVWRHLPTFSAMASLQYAF